MLKVYTDIFDESRLKGMEKSKKGPWIFGRGYSLSFAN